MPDSATGSRAGPSIAHEWRHPRRIYGMRRHVRRRDVEEGIPGRGHQIRSGTARSWPPLVCNPGRRRRRSPGHRACLRADGGGKPWGRDVVGGGPAAAVLDPGRTSTRGALRRRRGGGREGGRRGRGRRRSARVAAGRHERRGVGGYSVPFSFHSCGLRHHVSSNSHQRNAVIHKKCRKCNRSTASCIRFYLSTTKGAIKGKQ
jgi:hypothetical protein